MDMAVKKALTRILLMKLYLSFFSYTNFYLNNKYIKAKNRNTNVYYSYDYCFSYY